MTINQSINQFISRHST